MTDIVKKVHEFKAKYPMTIAWRLDKHAKIVENYINVDEEVIYTFAAQKNDSSFDIFRTCVVVLTNKRILIGVKRLLWGYFYTSITPDMFNDLSVRTGLIWGSVVIDTIKEEVVLSNIDKKALDDIETSISTFMLEEKQKYIERN